MKQEGEAAENSRGECTADPKEAPCHSSFPWIPSQSSAKRANPAGIAGDERSLGWGLGSKGAFNPFLMERDEKGK